jgi:hypothetical protein
MAGGFFLKDAMRVDPDSECVMQMRSIAMRVRYRKKSAEQRRLMRAHCVLFDTPVCIVTVGGGGSAARASIEPNYPGL